MEESKAPILANFEEWMKMATDNKINASNSWNFALIDYFHDLSLLREGDGINFKKASCTLDGCVKIYSSRIDSVASETGKLLSGLADGAVASENYDKNKDKDNQEDGEEGEEGEEVEEGGEGGENGENGDPKKKKKRSHRYENTLVSDFSQIKAKKFDLEFSVDPLFQKTSAEFDEGGAKGLLLNHLSIDNEGRIVFDANETVFDDYDEEEEENIDANGDDKFTDKDIEMEVEMEVDNDNENENVRENRMEIDTQSQKQTQTQTQTQTQQNFSSSQTPSKLSLRIHSLKDRYFPNLNVLSSLEVCPSLKNFDFSPNTKIDLPNFSQVSEASNLVNENQENDYFPMGNDDVLNDLDNDERNLNIPLIENPDFDDQVNQNDWGADAVNNRIITSTPAPESIDTENDLPNEKGVNGSGPSQNTNDIFSYFDETMKRSWAGPQHWKIRKLTSQFLNGDQNEQGGNQQNSKKKRKQKEIYQIDFFAQPIDPATLFVSGGSLVNLPKNQQKTPNRNLLPDDKHFNSKQLTHLFLKPNVSILSCRSNFGFFQNNSINNEENFLAGNNDGEDLEEQLAWASVAANKKIDPLEMNDANMANYDANFFDEANDNNDITNEIPPTISNQANLGEFSSNIISPPVLENDFNEDADSSDPDKLGFGSQLLAQGLLHRRKTEYVNYAKSAKKVDVKRLKDSIWSSLKFDNEIKTLSSGKRLKPNEDRQLKFTKVVDTLHDKYSKESIKDISTSFCFICLLHLANENGLELENNANYTDISIKVDSSAYDQE